MSARRAVVLVASGVVLAGCGHSDAHGADRPRHRQPPPVQHTSVPTKPAVAPASVLASNVPLSSPRR
jgi:hypothetical protein